MGYSYVDDRASGGVLREHNTTTCSHCGNIIVYQTKYEGLQQKQVRTTIRKGDLVRVEENGAGYFCTKCDKDICKFCGDQAHNQINHVSQESLAYATGNALAKGINIWTPQGQIYIQNQTTQKTYLGV